MKALTGMLSGVLFLLITPVIVFCADLSAMSNGRSIDDATIEAQNRLPEVANELGLRNPMLWNGLEVYDVSDNAIISSEKPEDIYSFAKATGIWLFPVSDDNSSDLLMSVRWETDKFTHRHNNVSLATDLIRLEQTWPESSGYNYRLISFSSFDIRYLEVSYYGDVIGLVRTDESEGIKFKPDVLIDPSEAASEIHGIRLSSNCFTYGMFCRHIRSRSHLV